MYYGCHTTCLLLITWERNIQPNEFWNGSSGQEYSWTSGNIAGSVTLVREWQKVKEIPLIPMPIIDEPFRWIAMDIVGPLPNAIKGNQYILAVCVYAMRYPEAFLLWMFTAPTVAEKLVKMFACYKIPEEILTEQGSILLLNVCRSFTNCCKSKQSRPVCTICRQMD